MDIKYEFERKKVDFINWKDAKKREAKIFWDENKEVLAPLILPAIAATVGIAKHTSRAYKAKQEELHWERDFYDPRTGTHYTTKRTPSQRQRVEIDRRFRNGEMKGEILRDMGLL